MKWKLWDFFGLKISLPLQKGTFLHSIVLFEIAQNQTNAKGLFLRLIVLCYTKRIKEKHQLKIFCLKIRSHACSTFRNFLMNKHLMGVIDLFQLHSNIFVYQYDCMYLIKTIPGLFHQWPDRLDCTPQAEIKSHFC